MPRSMARIEDSLTLPAILKSSRLGLLIPPEARVAVPDFQSLMRPCLAVHQDRQPHTPTDLRDRLAAQMHVSDERPGRDAAKVAGSRVSPTGWPGRSLTWPRRACLIVRLAASRRSPTGAAMF